MQSHTQGSELQLANLAAEVAAMKQRLLDYEQRLALVTVLDEWLSHVRDKSLGTAAGGGPAPGGTAGGDLGGTYPNPTVDDGADSTAIHDNVANEITGITNKNPVAADEFVVEDSAASYVKKAVLLSALEAALTHDNLVAGTIADHDTGATGAELDTLTDGSDADSLHDHGQFASAAEAISAVEGESTLALTGTLTVNPNTDVVATIGRAKVGWIGSMNDIAAFAHYDCDAGTDYALRQDPDGETHVNSKTGQPIKFRTNNASGTEGTFQVGVLSLPQLSVNSTPADDTVSGVTAELTAGTNLAWGDFCYIGADGKMEKALATAEATSRVVAFCIDTIAEDAAGTFLLQGFIRDDDGLEYTTIGDKVYLSDDTAGAADLTQPAGEDECIVILGIALDTWVLYFNPVFQAIVEHDAP